MGGRQADCKSLAGRVLQAAWWENMGWWLYCTHTGLLDLRKASCVICGGLSLFIAVAKKGQV